MASGARGPQAAPAQPCDAAWSGAPRAAGGSLKDARHRPQIPSDWCKVEGGRNPLPRGRGRAEQPVPGAALQPSPRARRGPQPALGGPRGSPTAAGKIGRGPAGEVARAPRLCLLAAPDAQDPVSGGSKKNRRGFNVNQGIGRLTNTPENKTHRKYIPEDVANHPLNGSSSSHNFSS
ncbi:uncharacterized protein LOC114675696 [Macaca mulatta]